MKKSWMVLLGGLALGTAIQGLAQDSWTDKISFSGDLRLRQEHIGQDGKDDRNRTRIRARLGAAAKVNDEVTAKMRLASGSDDPISRNQTLDGGFSSKDINLEQAYIIWSPEFLGVDLLGGKLSNPFIKVKDLIWDSDLNPEGVAFQSSTELEGLELLANGGVLNAEERSSDSDTLVYVGQLAAQLAPDGFKALVGASYYYYDNMEGFDPLYDPLDGFGNSTIDTTDPITGDVTSTAYANEFQMLEFFAKIDLKTAVPVSIYGDYVVNTEADDDDTGFQIGTKWGKAKDPGSVEFDVYYRDLEADAVVGAYTDSDFGGGGTGSEGFRFQAKYQLSKNWQFSATWLMNELKDEDSTDYDRGQFDLIAKF